jgi:hypothetical protein
MDDISDVLERLTHNNTYATDICLLLYLEEKYTSLYYLDYLNITGKELENLPKCCKDDSIDYLTQTIRFLRSGFLSKDEIMENLNSKNPVLFIDRLLIPGEDWEHAYENFAGNFRCRLSKNKGR